MPRLSIVFAPISITFMLATLLMGHSISYTASPTPVAIITARRDPCAGFTDTYFASPACDAVMRADPKPPVASLTVDHGTVASYTYMQVIAEDPVTVYDAPNGSPLYEIDTGFNFVTPRSVQENWVEINAGEWVKHEHLESVEPSRFTGVFLQAEPARPFGWFLETMYTSTRPGGPPVWAAEQHVKRYEIAYIYATVNVDGLDWYLVGPGKWIEQRYMGLAKRIPRPPEIHGHWVAIDLYEQTLVAYEDDTMIFATLVASGLAGMSTGTGTFQVWGRRLNGPMSGAEGQPDFYQLENVPYALYFDGHISLHGTYWHDGFGYRRSHGCVNLSISDAHWLYDWLGVGGWVYVYYSRPY
jgi:hypothetical protein